jgi:hypothetical protein
VTFAGLIAPSNLTWLGAGRELLAGSPAAPTVTIPLYGDSYGLEDTPTFLTDNGVRAVLADVFGKIAGPEDATFTCGGPALLTGDGIWLDNLFGDASGVSNGTLGTAQSLALPLTAGATSLLTTGGLGGVTTGSIVQIADGAASEIVTAGAGSTDTTVFFPSTPCRFAHTGAASAALQTAPVSYTHTFALLNSGSGQPPTHTLTDTTTLTPLTGARAYPGACVSQFEFSGDAEGLLTYKVSGNSWLSAPAAAAPVASTVFPRALANWRATVTVGGVPASDVGIWTVTFTRELMGYWSAGTGQTPFVFARGSLGITGTIDYTVPQDETPLTQMLTTSLLPVTITIGNGLTGQNERTMTIQMSAAKFTKALLGRGAGVLDYASTFEAVANATDTGGSGGLGPGTVTITNVRAAY